MKKRTGLVILATMFAVSLMVGCSKKESTETKKEVSNKEVSVMGSLENDENRVWLVIESNELTEDSKISYAFKSDGKDQLKVNEYIDATLEDANQVKTNKLWDYLSEQSQDIFSTKKKEKIDRIESDNQITEGMLNRIDPNNPNASVDGLGKGILEQMLKENKQAVEELTNLDKYKPVSLPVRAKVQKDSNGNDIIREVIEIGEEKKVAGYENEEYVSVLSKNYKLDLTRILTGDTNMLNYKYAGFGGNGIFVITRIDSNKQSVIFDSIDAGKVSELK